MPSIALTTSYTSDTSHAPSVILAAHERMRGANFPLVSIIAGRRVSDSRAFLCSWLRNQQRPWTLGSSLFA